MANLLKSVTYDGNTNYSTADAATTIYTANSAGLSSTIIIGMNISNIIDSMVAVSVSMYDSSQDQTVYLLKNVPLSDGAAVEVMTGNKLILNANDNIQLSSNAAYSVDTVLSIVEQT